MPLPTTDIQEFPSPFPGGGQITKKTTSTLDPILPDLRRQLDEIIGEGGVGLSPEQLDVQFRGISQQLQPTFNAQIERIDESAARRGVFRSGIPLQKAQETRLKQSQQLGQIRTGLDIQNEKMRSQTLLTALQMLQNLESDIYNREFQMQMLKALEDSQNQDAIMQLFAEGANFLMNRFAPGADSIAPDNSNTPLPTGGF